MAFSTLAHGLFERREDAQVRALRHIEAQEPARCAVALGRPLRWRPDLDEERFLAEQLRRLHEAGIGVFIVRGYHDALSQITRELTLPESVKVFSGRTEAIELACGGRPVAIHGLSFAWPEAPESRLPRYKPRLDGAINICLLHSSVKTRLEASIERRLYIIGRPLHGVDFTTRTGTCDAAGAVHPNKIGCALKSTL